MTTVLPDLLRDGLGVIFCGTAAGDASARAQAYYAGPGNAFWRTLYAVSLTPELLSPAEYPRLLDHGIGLTDVCKVRSGADQELAADDFDVETLVATIERHRPRTVAFNGKRSAQLVLGRRRVWYGPQAERLAGAAVFVLPSTSGAARGYWDVSHWHDLAAAIR